MTTVVTEVTFFSHVLFFSIFIIIIMINNYCLLILIKLLRGGNPNISCHIINIILKTRSVRIILWRESLSEEVHLASIYFYYFFILFFYYYLLLFVVLSLLRWEIIRGNHRIGEYSGGYFNLPQSRDVKTHHFWQMLIMWFAIFLLDSYSAVLYLMSFCLSLSAWCQESWGWSCKTSATSSVEWSVVSWATGEHWWISLLWTYFPFWIKRPYLG